MRRQRPLDVLREARERAGETLSAYVNTAVERQLQHDRVAELLAAQEAEFGPVPEDLLAQVRAVWSSSR